MLDFFGASGSWVASSPENGSFQFKTGKGLVIPVPLGVVSALAFIVPPNCVAIRLHNPTSNNHYYCPQANPLGGTQVAAIGAAGMLWVISGGRSEMILQPPSGNWLGISDRAGAGGTLIQYA